MFTVITRTANRPLFFEECRRSVLAQTQKAFHLVVSDDPSDAYPQGDFLALVERQEGRAHNTYFNEVRRHIPPSHPWVIFLDDDDRFETPDALLMLARHIRDADDLLLWQVRFSDRLIPGGMIYLPPKPGHISGIGFCYHSKHWVDWPPMGFGDYHVINKLYSTLRPVWLDHVLTGLQKEQGFGFRNDLKYGIHPSTC